MMMRVKLMRWLLPVAGVLIMVVFAATAFAWGAWTAKAYESDFDRWASEVRPKANGSVRIPNAAFGYWYPINGKDLKDQAGGCDEVRGGRPSLVAATGKLPRITRLPVDWLGPSYGEAVDRDQRRARVVKTFSNAADRALRQMERDCAFEGKVLRLDARRDAQWDRSDKLADPPSALFCDDKDGCIPDDAVRRRKFASAVAKSNDHQRAVGSLYRTNECESTSFGASCKEVADAIDRYLDAEDEYVRQVRALTASSTGFAVNQAADRADRALKKYEKTLRRMLPKQVPGVEDFADFKDDPTSVDRFLLGVTNLRVRELLDERTALRRL